MYNITMTKRPDLVLRNKLNNPMSNPATREKMRQSLLGKKIPKEVKEKMSTSRKRFIKENPDAIRPMLDGAEKKYLSKIRGTGWRSVRLKALERDSYTCCSCGETNRKLLLVHHLDWNGKRQNIPITKWNNSLDNLQTLCHKCHNRVHRHKSSDYQKRLNQKIAP